MEAKLFSELITMTTMKWSLIINKQQIYMHCSLLVDVIPTDKKSKLYII